ncbi:hypothetical protein F5Y19DRAFT_475382 [Xylariaceae sp. FL1651]|nr:hypothetical protein F5Y19DRAFT_475382 [Xylariaceae sp. FL1651]
MDAVSTYSFASCAWHGLQAVPLIIWPHVISSLLTVDNYPQTAGNEASAVENYLARSLGFALLALGLVTVVLTGSVPVGSVVDTNTISPFAAPVLLLTTLHHGVGAFHCWARYNATGETGFCLGFVGSTALAAFGIWCLLFGGEKARISRRTGADKRTSGFPFRNAEADRRKQR